MKVLWLCSIMLPRIAENLGFIPSNKEGWVTGLSDMILKNTQENRIELGVCFPVQYGTEKLNGEVDGIKYYSFYENTNTPWKYDGKIENGLKEIIEQFQPDIVHVFGTEFPHTLAMAKVFKPADKILVGIQGICYEIAKAYMADLPRNIQIRFLIRDFLKQDNILQQQRKFVARGINEIAALNKITHVTGRTDFDKRVAKECNSEVVYHFMNETLRSNFYDKRWKYNQCQPYSVFLCQGNYPLKGLHYLLEALTIVKVQYPKVSLYVAGDIITKNKTLKEKIKLSSYGSYILSLIKKFGLENSVHFVGKLNSEEMCQRYLESNVCVSASALENSPNSVGEAMLLGMPVISSDVGGARNLLTDGIEGYLYPHQNIEELASCICKVFAEGDKVTRLGNNARARAMVTHDASSNYHRLLDIYKSIQDRSYDLRIKEKTRQ